FLDKFGGKELRGKLIDSVKAHAHRRDEMYRCTMEKYRNRGKLKKAEKDNDFERLAALLREIIRTEAPEFEHNMPKKDIYSMYDLEYAAVSITAYSKAISSIRENGCGSEARQALSVSMFSMKLEVISARIGVSDEMKETVRDIESESQEEMLNAMEEYFGGKVRRDIFAAVYNTVMSAFRITGDAAGAIHEGAKRAKPMLRDAADSKDRPERFEAELCSGGYWDNFSKKLPYGKNGLQQYADEWQEWIGKVMRL
ncbi:MAG: hypothetical protein IJC39_02900, partial [Firmicutes bacterium]|nr:hypothetical protein [Bacillota bacterium]